MVETDTVINRSDLNSDIFFRETVKVENTYVDYAKDNVTCLITGLYRFDKQTNEVLVNNFGDQIVKVQLRTKEGHVHYESMNTQTILFNDRQIPPFQLRNLCLAVGVYSEEGEGNDKRKIIADNWFDHLVGHEIEVDFILKNGWARIKNIRPLSGDRGGITPDKSKEF